MPRYIEPAEANGRQNEAVTQETLIKELESVANFMRGMQLDPSIPTHAKEALHDRVTAIDELTERRSGD